MSTYIEKFLENQMKIDNLKKETYPKFFKNEKHQSFYDECINKSNSKDSYHRALFYTLGISNDTIINIDNIYDFKNDEINTSCLNSGWITSGSAKLIYLAFNLYTNSMPTIDNSIANENIFSEALNYTPTSIFEHEDGYYFIESIRLRFFMVNKEYVNLNCN